MIISFLQGCSTDYFGCHNTSQCIPWPWVCDNDPDCYDSSDESLDLCKNSGKCGGNFNSSSGVLTSPSYPDKYQDKADCIYIIEQPTGTFVSLTNLMFYLNDHECKDYLEIRDGISEESSLIGKFCGLNFPASIQATQNHVWMK